MFDEDYGVQSYFGESGDCDFFGDTSMNGGFASGMGGAGFVSEAFAQDSMGGSFFTEASEFDSSVYGNYFSECGDLYEESSNSLGGKHWSDSAEARSKSIEDGESKHYMDSKYKGAKPKANGNSTHVTPEHIENLRHSKGQLEHNPESIWKRDVFETSKREYDTAKSHGREVGKHIDSNK